MRLATGWLEPGWLYPCAATANRRRDQESPRAASSSAPGAAHQPRVPERRESATRHSVGFAFNDRCGPLDRQICPPNRWTGFYRLSQSKVNRRVIFNVLLARVSGWRSHARLSLRRGTLRQRLPVVLDAATGHQDGAAILGRIAGGVEYGDDVLSGDAARRLCLCAFHRPDRKTQPAILDSRRDRGRRLHLPAVWRRSELGRAGRRVADLMVDRSAPGVRRLALLRSVGIGASASGLVRTQRASHEQRSVFPLQRKQSGQPAGAAGFSVPARAVIDIGDAKPDVDGNLRAAAASRSAPARCSRVGARPTQDTHSTRQRSRTRQYRGDREACGWRLPSCPPACFSVSRHT